MTFRRTLSDPRQRARLALFAGIAGGLLTAVFFALFRPNPPTTFNVFYFAAQKSMSGPIAYETGYGLWTYTPAALLYFYPYALLFDYPTALVVHRVLSAVVTVGYAVALVRFLGDHIDLQRLDRVAVFGFATLSVYPVVNVINGSFVGIFATFLGMGWLLVESDRDGGGALWALASIVKGYPAFWGIYLLRVRRWRAVGAAILTGVSATLLGVLVFGFQEYVRFFTVAGTDRVRYHKFAGGRSPDNEAVTPLRALGQLFPDVDPAVWTPVILVVVVCITLVVYYLIPGESLNDRATLLLVTILGVWFVMPTSQDLDVYILYAPLLVLLYVERERQVQSLYALGTVVLSYNFGRTELRAVSEMVGIADAVMLVGEPVLRFATMPMYGLVALYVGCLVKARIRGRESTRTARLRARAGDLFSG
ncbi:glycosyltransferase family 87 protein [Haloarcula laminariae]|uniref:glycosyltransferase family 87 protein n=1 Tax=Haloarcula laminariae TaxID=2961577 RepID=UPI002406D436|nr:glycosyltransferase family 87 protein [Halomicroarcula sp. FL173]